MTWEWRHVRPILMQNKGLQEPLSWTQFLSYKVFFCMKWRRIEKPIELLSRIFKFLNNKENIWFFWKKYFWFFWKFVFICRTKRNICYRTYQNEPVLKISAYYVKKWLSYTTFRSSVYGVWKIIIIQMDILTYSRRRITN